MFERIHKQKLTERILSDPRQFIQVVYGPRQVGKTTMVQQFLKPVKISFRFYCPEFVIRG